MYVKRISPLLLLLAVANLVCAQQSAKRPLKLDDLARIREVRDPHLSPDGQWIAYVVSAVNVKEDKSNSHIWMAGYDGKSDRQITGARTARPLLVGARTENTWPSPHRGPARPKAARCGC